MNEASDAFVGCAVIYLLFTIAYYCSAVLCSNGVLSCEHIICSPWLSSDLVSRHKATLSQWNVEKTLTSDIKIQNI